MSETTAGTDYRKQLRYRVALLTGLVTMRDELDTDIADLMSSMGAAQQEPVRRGRPPKLLPAPVAALPPVPDASNGHAKRSKWTAERRKAASKRAVAQWAAAKQDAPPTTTQGKANKVYPKTWTPRIGFGTNAEFIYDFAMTKQGALALAEAKAAAAKSPKHHNLTTGTRLTVAIAEMKRKGLIEHANGVGNYRLTPLAVQTRQRELKNS